MILDSPLRLPRLHKQLMWFKGNKYHFISQFPNDRAPETSELAMSIGTLTCRNLGSRQCTLEFQPSVDQSWQSWAENDLNHAATYRSPYANVHKGQLSKMGGTIGNDSNCTWQVHTQEKRQEDLEVLSSPVDTTEIANIKLSRPQLATPHQERIGESVRQVDIVNRQAEVCCVTPARVTKSRMAQVKSAADNDCFDQMA
ncbi:unnamed protein product [Porites evermanni]|uniref:Uncharacterized protein n=1 Tax=Porites evermanni TaxID=104178 RepID=A0ABN8T356_9CNID|nr:unnamed protein product [Porites evermanni]CAH3198640.1 unnamed protein product [Porites evermanni]